VSRLAGRDEALELGLDGSNRVSQGDPLERNSRDLIGSRVWVGAS
jgi:hypothetical protein